MIISHPSTFPAAICRFVALPRTVHVLVEYTQPGPGAQPAGCAHTSCMSQELLSSGGGD